LVTARQAAIERLARRWDDRPHSATSWPADLTAKYLRPATTETGSVTVKGAALSKGSRTALAQARLIDSHDRPLA